MKWRLDHNGDYVKAGWRIEHSPARNSQRPYFVYQTDSDLVYIGNFETLEIAKRNAK